MEKLKSTIPATLKRRISESKADDLNSTCSSLDEFLNSLPLFHQLIDDLTKRGLCCKNEAAAMEAKRKGNECFLKGEYSDALGFYSQALRVAPMDSVDKENNLVAVLYVNRASTFHKMGLHLECLRDCRRALAVNPRYAKAWYRRGNASTSLENYRDGVFDLKMAALMEHSTSGKRQIERELNIVLTEHKVESSLVDWHNDKWGCIHGKLLEAKMAHLFWSQCAAHCIDLMLEDICKFKTNALVLKRAIFLYGYIYNRTHLVNMMREFTSQKNLVRPATTRFATVFLTCKSLHNQQANLRKMFVSDNQQAKHCLGCHSGRKRTMT